jgi:hypothetical protein
MTDDKKEIASLKEENRYLRAIIGRCISCHRQRDPEAVFEFETKLVGANEYMSVLWFSGGVDGRGSSEVEAQHQAMNNFNQILAPQLFKSMQQPHRELSEEFLETAND